MGLPVRPAAMDELQAASAVGQGRLYRVYEELLTRARRAAGAGAAHVLRHVRAHALPERAPDAAAAARRGACAGDQRERHDDHRRDLVRRQRLPGGAGGDPARRRPAAAAHRHRRAVHRRPAPRPRTPSWSPRCASSRSSRRSRSACRARRSARAGCARRWWRPRWRRRPGSRRGSRTARARSVVARRVRAASDAGTRFHAAGGARVELQAVAEVREADAAARLVVDEGAERALRERARACCRSGSSRWRASSRPATRSRSRAATAAPIGKGIVNYSAAELRRVKGLKTRRGPRAAAARGRRGRAPRLLRARSRPLRIGRSRRTAVPFADGTTQSVAEICAAAKEASRTLARLDTATKDAALEAIAAALEARVDEILEANARDVEAGARGRARRRRCSTGCSSTEERVAGDRARRARRSRRCPTRSARCSRATGCPTGSTCARCACRSASSRSSTRRGRT